MTNPDKNPKKTEPKPHAELTREFGKPVYFISKAVYERNKHKKPDNDRGRIIQPEETTIYEKAALVYPTLGDDSKERRTLKTLLTVKELLQSGIDVPIDMLRQALAGASEQDIQESVFAANSADILALCNRIYHDLQEAQKSIDKIDRVIVVIPETPNLDFSTPEMLSPSEDSISNIQNAVKTAMEGKKSIAQIMAKNGGVQFEKEESAPPAPPREKTSESAKLKKDFVHLISETAAVYEQSEKEMKATTGIDTEALEKEKVQVVNVTDWRTLNISQTAKELQEAKVSSPNDFIVSKLREDVQNYLRQHPNEGRSEEDIMAIMLLNSIVLDASPRGANEPSIQDITIGITSFFQNTSETDNQQLEGPILALLADTNLLTNSMDVAFRYKDAIITEKINSDLDFLNGQDQDKGHRFLIPLGRRHILFRYSKDQQRFIPRHANQKGQENPIVRYLHEKNVPTVDQRRERRRFQKKELIINFVAIHEERGTILRAPDEIVVRPYLDEENGYIDWGNITLDQLPNWETFLPRLIINNVNDLLTGPLREKITEQQEEIINMLLLSIFLKSNAFNTETEMMQALTAFVNEINFPGGKQDQNNSFKEFIDDFRNANLGIKNFSLRRAWEWEQLLITSQINNLIQANPDKLYDVYLTRTSVLTEYLDTPGSRGIYEKTPRYQGNEGNNRAAEELRELYTQLRVNAGSIPEGESRLFKLLDPLSENVLAAEAAYISSPPPVRTADTSTQPRINSTKPIRTSFAEKEILLAQKFGIEPIIIDLQTKLTGVPLVDRLLEDRNIPEIVLIPEPTPEDGRREFDTPQVAALRRYFERWGKYLPKKVRNPIARVIKQIDMREDRIIKMLESVGLITDPTATLTDAEQERIIPQIVSFFEESQEGFGNILNLITSIPQGQRIIETVTSWGPIGFVAERIGLRNSIIAQEKLATLLARPLE